jgi:structural maintenance of chromosome 1
MQNLREEVAMDIDEDEEATQRPKAVADYGIEVNFDLLDEDDRTQDSAEMIAQFEKEISSTNNDIERMAPNMKAIERYIYNFFALMLQMLMFVCRLDDVEAKLADTEKEADKARKDSRSARDHFNEIKTRRYVPLFDLEYVTFMVRV